MKLSEAIKKGRKKRPQVRGDFKKLITLPDGTRTHGTCDLGAAYEGLTGQLPPHSKTDIATDVLNMLDRELNSREFVDVAFLPEGVYADSLSRLSSVVIELNDKLKWPTEKTVAWLESIGQ